MHTPQGNVVITGDLRLRHENGVPTEKEQEVWGKIGKEDNLLFIADGVLTSRFNNYHLWFWKKIKIVYALSSLLTDTLTTSAASRFFFRASATHLSTLAR